MALNETKMRRIFYQLFQKLLNVRFFDATSEKIVYLTFDDGPHPEITPWLLDFLEKEKIKATFFCLARHIQQHPTLFDSYKTQGHMVASHGHEHLSGFKISLKSFQKNVEKAQGFFASKAFRPPYGKLGLRQYLWLRKTHHIILWDVMAYDFSNTSPEKLLKRLKRLTKPGSIVVFHENKKAFENLKVLLPEYIKHLKGLGYTFKLDIPPSTPIT